MSLYSEGAKKYLRKQGLTYSDVDRSMGWHLGNDGYSGSYGDFWAKVELSGAFRIYRYNDDLAGIGGDLVYSGVEPDDYAAQQEVVRWIAEYGVTSKRKQAGAQRAAIVLSKDSDVSRVEAYMPSNYSATDVLWWHGKQLDEMYPGAVFIVGEDDAGWTLDDYVIPRLASGMIIAEEIPPSGELSENAQYILNLEPPPPFQPRARKTASANVLNVKKEVGVAGQFVYMAEVQYEGEDPMFINFYGNSFDSGVGSVIMEFNGDPKTQTYVSDPTRFGYELNEAWVRSFFATTASRKRAKNPQSGYGETALDHVEVTDDNADEQPMFPWEIGEIGDDVERAASHNPRTYCEVAGCINVALWEASSDVGTAFVCDEHKGVYEFMNRQLVPIHSSKRKANLHGLCPKCGKPLKVDSRHLGFYCPSCGYDEDGDDARVEVDVRAGSKTASAYGAWGFTEMLVASNTHDFSFFTNRMNDAARDRGIDPGVESDALDASRDIILDEAISAAGYEWDIVGGTLRVWPQGVSIDFTARRKTAESEYGNCATCKQWTGTRDSEGNCPDCTKTAKKASSDPVAVVKEKYAWPGGYELFAVTDDGGILCFNCVIAEEDIIRSSYPGDGWHVVAYDHTGNYDLIEINCDNCYRVIDEGFEGA